MDLKNAEEVKAQLSAIKARQYVGPIAPAMPMPDPDGIPRHLAVLDGVTIWAHFAQQPPAGSIPVDTGDTCWRGSLLFLAEDGDLWTVPHIWYNARWKHRVEFLEFTIRNGEATIKQARVELVGLRETVARSGTWAAKQQVRDLEWMIKERTQANERTRAYVAHIKKHADLEGIPSMHPIPEYDTK